MSLRLRSIELIFASWSWWKKVITNNMLSPIHYKHTHISPSKCSPSCQWQFVGPWFWWTLEFLRTDGAAPAVSDVKHGWWISISYQSNQIWWKALKVMHAKMNKLEITSLRAVISLSLWSSKLSRWCLCISASASLLVLSWSSSDALADGPNTAKITTCYNCDVCKKTIMKSRCLQQPTVCLTLRDKQRNKSTQLFSR